MDANLKLSPTLLRALYDLLKYGPFAEPESFDQAERLEDLLRSAAAKANITLEGEQEESA